MWCWVIVASLAMIGACGGDDPFNGGDDDTAGDDDTTDDDDDDLLDAFFSLSAVHDIDIDVGSDGYQSLLDDPRTYVSGDVSIDGTALAQVGVRLKGGPGTFVALDGDYAEITGDGNGNPGKSALILDFNRFADGQVFRGLEKLTLNNMNQDPSGIHEYLTYALFREGSVPASRVGYAQITLNGELKGIYAMLESNDNTEFLQSWYGTDDGTLYEGESGADLRPEDVQDFDQDHGEDESRQDLAEVADALAAAGTGDDAMEVLQQHLDLDEYLAFAATEMYLGHWDGYAASANNYKVHHTPDGPWSFLPWGTDQTFVDTLGTYAGVIGGTGPHWACGGLVHEICFESDECLALLRTAFEEVLDRVDEMDLAGRAEDAAELVEPLVLAEAEAHRDPELTISSIEGVSTFIQERRSQIEAWVPCLTGDTTDTDGDGYDGCSEDCDDTNPDIHPGAEEQCNFVDDDCNMILDDDEDCPDCYETIGLDGADYALCLVHASWDEAYQHCLARGQDLASFHDHETWDVLTQELLNMLGEEQTWIGLSDHDVPGTFAWTDGSPLDFQNWSSGAPYNEPDAHCVASSPQGWWNQSCNLELAFSCKGP